MTIKAECPLAQGCKGWASVIAIFLGEHSPSLVATKSAFGSAMEKPTYFVIIKGLIELVRAAAGRGSPVGKGGWVPGRAAGWPDPSKIIVIPPVPSSCSSAVPRLIKLLQNDPSFPSGAPMATICVWGRGPSSHLPAICPPLFAPPGARRAALWRSPLQAWITPS